MEPIHIDREVAEAAGVPDDLDAGNVGHYQFPDPRRRRIAAAIYLGLAAVGLLVLPTRGGFVFAAALALLAGWHYLAGWPLNVGPEQALDKAATVAPYAIGHSSAAITFHGWRARPRWHVILYDASSPPAQRALIVIDGVTCGLTGEPYIEDLAVRDT
ncbi:MAG TPA: hypothetical protein VM470_04920 [Acidimicrobiia bacterium]|nr:hypothetical protein [Acidimicrobiia bacterium]